MNIREPLFAINYQSDRLAGDSIQARRLNTLIGQARSLYDLVDGWMHNEPHNGLNLSSGMPQEVPQIAEPVVVIEFSQKNEVLAQAYCLKAELKQGREFDLNVDDAGHVFEEYDCLCDEAWHERRDSSLGIKFNELFCEHHIHRSKVEELFLIYVLGTLPVELELFHVDEDSLLDRPLDDDDAVKISRLAKRYVCINVSVFEPKTLSASSSEFISFVQ